MVTLMVDPDQAQALQLAMEHGKITLAMRNPQDSKEISDHGVTSVNHLIKNSLKQLKQSVSSNFSEMFTAALMSSAVAKNAGTPTRSAAAETTAAGNQSRGRQWKIQIFHAGEEETVLLPLPASFDFSRTP